MTTPRLLFLVFCVLAFGGVVSAEVRDGETYKLGPNGVVTVSITNVPTMGEVTVSISNTSGQSNSAAGTPGPNNSNSEPTCDDTNGNQMNLDHDGDPATDSVETRIHNGHPSPGRGKLQYKNEQGDWVNATKVRKGGLGQGDGSSWIVPGPLPNIDVPGEEVTGLPVTEQGGPHRDTPWSGRVLHFARP